MQLRKIPNISSRDICRQQPGVMKQVSAAARSTVSSFLCRRSRSPACRTRRATTVFCHKVPCASASRRRRPAARACPRSSSRCVSPPRRIPCRNAGGRDSGNQMYSLSLYVCFGCKIIPFAPENVYPNYGLTYNFYGLAGIIMKNVIFAVSLQTKDNLLWTRLLTSKQ